MRLLYLNRSRVLVCLLATEALLRRLRIRFGGYTWHRHMGSAMLAQTHTRPFLISEMHPRNLLLLSFSLLPSSCSKSLGALVLACHCGCLTSLSRSLFCS
jgi:hypothetical protein